MAGVCAAGDASSAKDGNKPELGSFVSSRANGGHYLGALRLCNGVGHGTRLRGSAAHVTMGAGVVNKSSEKRCDPLQSFCNRFGVVLPVWGFSPKKALLLSGVIANSDFPNGASLLRKLQRRGGIQVLEGAQRRLSQERRNSNLNFQVQ